MAAIYDPLVAPFDPLGVRRWRRWVISAARGRVLELGIGTGMNLPHYSVAESRSVQTAVSAIDPDLASLRRAFSRRSRAFHPVALYQARAEELPFSDDAFDVVVGSLVFCSIRDPNLALREVRRVLKSGGVFRVIEHVRAPNHIVADLQDAVTPVWKHVAGNCHLNRDTLAAVESSGLSVREVHRHLGGVVIGIDAFKL